MTRHMFSWGVMFAIAAGVGSAQRPISKPNAANASDYAKVATYFHYQELVFRARAQNAIDMYAKQARRYPMATKTITRAEALEHQYNAYLSKAEKSARWAAKYDQRLEELGCKPTDVSSAVVSVMDLQKTWNEVLGN